MSLMAEHLRLAIGMVYAAFVAIIPMTASGTVFLRYSLNDGDKALYISSAYVVQTMETMGMESTNRAGLSTRIYLDVSADPLQHYVLSFRYDTAFMRGTFDNGMGQPRDTAMVFAGLANMSESYTINPSGTTIARSENDDVPRDLLGIVPASSLGGGRAIVIVFPGRELEIDDAWTTTSADTIPARDGRGVVITTATTEYVYRRTLDTLQTRCAELSFRTIAFKLEGNVVANGMDMILDGGGRIIGKALVELKTGLPVLITVDAVMDSRLAVTGAASFIVPVTMETQAVISRQRFTRGRR